MIERHFLRFIYDYLSHLHRVRIEMDRDDRKTQAVQKCLRHPCARPCEIPFHDCACCHFRLCHIRHLVVYPSHEYRPRNVTGVCRSVAAVGESVFETRIL